MVVLRSEWERLMQMLETMSMQQAELLAQLSRANTRIEELEAQKDRSLTHRAPSNPHVVPARPQIQPTIPFKYSVKAGPTENSTTAPKPSNSPKKTWAQIAAEPRPSIKDVSPATLERLRKGMALLDIQTPAPTPTALYFRNIRRARLGQLRKALRQMFTHPWAVLGLSFIGKSVIEIVCHKGLADQIVAKLRLIGATHIKNMDVFGDNLKKKTSAPTGDRLTANLERAHQRFQRLVSTCTSTTAKSWYAKQAAEAEKRLAAIYQKAHDVETSVSEDSGYDSEDVITAPQSSASNEMVVETPSPSPIPVADDPTSEPMDLSPPFDSPLPSKKTGASTDLAQEAPQEN